jgi:hypothetical protein
MKKLLILLLLLPAVSAETLLDDWVDHPSTFTLADHEFSVQYIDSKEKLVMKMDGLGGLLDIDECEKREDIEYCFIEANLVQVKLLINSLAPDIEIERDFSTKKPLLNEEIDIIATITNNGDKRASNVVYEDPYTSKFKKTSSDWQGNLNPGEEKIITYTVTPLAIEKINSQASISYDFDGKKKTKSSKTILIEVQEPFTLTHSLVESAEKNERIFYNVTLINKGETKLDINTLKIIIPAKMDIKNAPRTLKQDGNTLTYAGSLEENERQTFIIQLASSKVGTMSITLDAQLLSTFTKHLEKEISIGLSDIIPIIEIPSEIKANTQYDFYIATKNAGKDAIESIQMNVKSDLIDSMVRNKKIEAKATYTIFNKKLTAPYLDAEQTYTTTLTGYYATASGKNKSFKQTATTKIIPTPQVIQIFRTFNKEKLKRGDTVQVQVSIKNKLNKEITNVDLFDNFPKEIRPSLEGEVTTLIETLQPNQELQVYTYSLTVPEDYDKNEIEFKTTLSTKIDDALTILKRSDTLQVTDAIVPVTTLADQQQAATTIKIEAPDPETPETTPNSLKKFFTWLRTIFKSQPINSTLELQ